MERRNFLQYLSALTGGTLAGGLLTESHQENHNGSDHHQLQDHTIESIEFRDVKLQYPRLVGKNSYKGIHGRGPTINVSILKTDKGASGWGIARGGGDYLKNSTEYVKGKKITDVFDPGQGIIDDKALPFDIALHDLSGIILDIPVYEMLGRNEPFTTNCYSGMIYFDELGAESLSAGMDKILEECQYDIDHGYRQLKVKIGRGSKWMDHDEGLQRDIEVTKMIDEHFPEIDILVDANNGYSVEDTIAYLEGIGDIKLFWFEEPFNENRENYLELRKWMLDHGIETFLADGEYQPDQDLLRSLYRQRLLDVHLTDIIGLSFSRWRQLMPQLVEMGISASPHCWGSQLKTYYTAHLCGGLGNMPTIEGVTCTSGDVDFGKYELEEGILTPSPDPGFGMELI
mgnify:CR=1 FL=1